MGRTFRKNSPYKAHPKRNRDLKKQKKYEKKHQDKHSPLINLDDFLDDFYKLEDV